MRSHDSVYSFRRESGSMGRILGIALLCMAITSGMAQMSNAPAESRVDLERTKWISDTFQSIQTVKVGATRAELLKLFTTEGGLSTPSRRTYVYRRCSYIKVDVKFAVSGREQELPTDTIVEISRPYLARSAMD